MLLTSSQVSVAISSVIVFLFTTALFLAGYVLQQQTVRDLRAAIKPQIARGLPELQVFIQPEFGEDDDVANLESVDPSPQHIIVDEDKSPGTNGERKTFERGNEYVEDEMDAGTRRRKVKAFKEQLAFRTGNKEKEAEPQTTEAEEVEDEPQNTEAGKAEGEPAPVKDDRGGNENPREEALSRAARRKKIREQILADGDGEHFTGYRRRAW